MAAAAAAEESAVKVCVRVRPLIQREEGSTESPEPVQLYWKADTKSIHQIEDGTPTKSFSYDRVFSSTETTNHLYQDIAKPLVVSTVEGYNGTIFAYGQTSSGKTFTMMGSDLAPGVIPLSMEEVFQTIKNFPNKEFLLRLSYMEIYNETVTDLLVDSWKRKPLEVRETLNKNIFVADLTEELVTSPSQALAWIRKGEENRHYGKTKMNQRSSRSHTIFRMILESRERSDPASGENSDGAIIVSHLNLVDLAGSERASQTGAEGARFKEGCNINRSLFTLAQVIKKLSDESLRGFTNYRDSKLTRILQNSLGGNAKTVIICTITPETMEQTLSTLQFASTAKKMKNDPHVTEVSDDGALLKRYRNEIVDLKRRLQEVSSVTQTTVTEKQTLSQLLQEKDQLQKEQQDRIKNLTKLLVTASTFVTAKKMPKRRVTWGGKLLRLAATTECDVGQSNLSFAEHFSRKKKAELSSMELLEDDEDIESRWEVPHESSCNEMDMNQTGSVSGHSYEDSPQFVSMSAEKVANLEQQLEEERSLREEVLSRASSLEQQLEEERSLREEGLSRASSLEQQLEEERSLREEGLSRASSLEQQLEEERSLREEVLSGASSLEQQLEEERSLREEGLSRASSLEQQLEEERSLREEGLSRASFLEQEVELLAREKLEAWEEVHRAVQRKEEQEVQLSAQAQEKQEAWEKVEMLELRLADLEENHVTAEPHEQVLAERNHLQQEVVLLLQQVSSLEEQKGFLSQELQEKKEEEEFRALEEDCSKEEQSELHKEIGSLKSTVESWEVKCRDLESQLGSKSQQLVKTSSRVEELESLQGKDLLQQISSLRRSLDDAEGLSRDTRKEWAELRSQNLSLKERDAGLSSSHDQMVVEVTGLRSQLEKEKSRFRSMQTDLQKELLMAFEENTKLTTLLDGKVPKNLLESARLEGTIAALNKELIVCREAESVRREELTVCREAEAALREELRTAPEQLREQLSSSEQQRSFLEGQLNSLQVEKETLQVEKEALREDKETLQVEKETLQVEKETLQVEKETLQVEMETLQVEMETLREEKETLQMETLREEKETLQMETLQVEMGTLQEEKETLQEEKETLQEEKETLREEKETLREEKETMREEKEALQVENNQLKMDLQENVEMMIENQDELRTALGKVREQEGQIKRLESLPTANQNTPALDSALEIEDLHNQVKCLGEELQEERQKNLENVDQERMSLLDQQVKALSAELQAVSSERDTQRSSSGPEEVERLVSEVAALSQEREQLREEKKQLREEMEDKIHMILQQQQQPSLSCELGILDQHTMEDVHNTIQSLTEEKHRLERELQLSSEKAEEMQGLLSSLQEQLKQVMADLETQSQEYQARLHQRDAETQGVLEALQQELQEERQKNLENVDQERMSLLDQQVKALSAELQAVSSERDTQRSSSGPEEVERLVSEVAALSQEREQLREEKKQLREEMEDKNHNIQCLEENMESERIERNQLKTDLQDNVEMMIENQEELRKALDKIRSQKAELVVLRNQGVEESSSQTEPVLDNAAQLRELQQQIQHLSAELQAVRSERDTRRSSSGPEEVERLVSEVAALSQEREQLREEKQQLREEMEDNIHMIYSTQEQLNLEQRSESQKKEDLLQQQIWRLELLIDQTTNERIPLQEQLACMEEEKTRLQEQLACMEEEKTGLQEQLACMEEEKTGLQEQLACMEEEKTGLQEQLACMGEKTGLQEEVAHIRKEKTELQEQLTRMEEEKTGLQEQLTHMEQEKTGLQEQLTRMEQEKTGLQEQLTRMEEEKTGLQEQVTRMEEERDELQEQLACTEEKLATRVEERRAFQEEVAHVRKEKTRLQEELATRVEERRTFQEEVAHLRKEKAGLQEEVALWVEEKRTFQEEVAHLRKEKTRLQEEVARGVEESRTFQEEVAHLRKEKTRLQEEVARGVEESRTFQEEVAHVRKEKTGLQEELTRMAEDKRSLQEEVNLQQEKLVSAATASSALLEKMPNQDPRSNHSDVVAMATPEDLSSRLKDTTRRLKDSAESFQLFISRCSSHSVAPLDETLLEISVFREQQLSSLPKGLLQLYGQLTRHHVGSIRGLADATWLLKCSASDYQRRVEELVHSDLAVLEQQRLQDVLLSSTAPGDDLHALWEHRLTGLLDRRERYLQRMASQLDVLEERLGGVSRSLAAQLGEMRGFQERLKAVCSHTPLDHHTLDHHTLEDLLTAELEHSSAAALLHANTVQAVQEARTEVRKELQELAEEATAGLEEERSKTSTLLRALDNPPLKAEELQLLRDNQRLLLQLQDAHKHLTVLQRELEEVQLRSTERLSNHKRTTQLLQTELQDKDSDIQTLRTKLEEEARTQAPPGVLEVEMLRNKVVKLEVEVTSATSKHQQEMRSLTSRLNIKEESLRKLRETLRKTQQEQQESFMQGEDLYCKLTAPRGSKVQSSDHLERSKLEEEVRVLQLKVTELDSLVSSQRSEICSHQAEISKWKARAFNLKEKNKLDRPRSPTATVPSRKHLLPPTESDASDLLSSPKRFHRMPCKVLDSPRKVRDSPRKVRDSPRKILDSPRKVLDSPRKVRDSPRKVRDSPRKVLDSPQNMADSQKTTFFGPGSGAGFEKLSKNHPRQFFDNSNLGIDPEVSCVPSNTEEDSKTIEEDASVSVDRKEGKEEWWPLSPKQKDVCKTQ